MKRHVLDCISKKAKILRRFNGKFCTEKGAFLGSGSGVILDGLALLGARGRIFSGLRPRTAAATSSRPQDQNSDLRVIPCTFEEERKRFGMSGLGGNPREEGLTSSGPFRLYAGWIIRRLPFLE